MDVINGAYFFPVTLGQLGFITIPAFCRPYPNHFSHRMSMSLVETSAWVYHFKKKGLWWTEQINFFCRLIINLFSCVSLDQQSSDVVSQPSLDEAVFCRVIVDIGDFQLDEWVVGRYAHRCWRYYRPCELAQCAYSYAAFFFVRHRDETVVLEKDQIYIFRYKTVRTLLQRRQIELIWYLQSDPGMVSYYSINCHSTESSPSFLYFDNNIGLLTQRIHGFMLERLYSDGFLQMNIFQWLQGVSRPWFVTWWYVFRRGV